MMNGLTSTLHTCGESRRFVMDLNNTERRNLPQYSKFNTFANTDILRNTFANTEEILRRRSHNFPAKMRKQLLDSACNLSSSNNAD